ncbi:phage terminase large subunit [Brachyspira hampsonii]|uniref:Phage terminase large subunit n=1 Tax=Brachyspira hampsonii 30446 TaxID=1289135 RepID=A0A2U4EY26_9SPIR|nr:phage terminase large subunit [Brachyspira hampsonii]EKV58268.1 Phage terminase large subunit [Brachyspira hampsonii 30446]MBW5388867.1 terminase [Brachyspira hampsonii]MBW5394066.1 terminase [Brachyspira hampsonii]OEJ17688.1 terminase [Brachyspira hampsonii]
MTIDFNILKPFEKWANTEKRLKIAFGGRGGGKSESIARILIAKSFEKSGVILCSREIQKSISYSTYPLLISIIKELHLENFFNIKRNEIINKATNCKFIFLGIRECSIEEIKSIYNVRICFIEEAQTLTQRSYEILEPSIRAEKSEIWIAFNPRFETDFIYKTVIKFNLENKFYTDKNNNKYNYKEYEDSSILITFINYDGNYYFSDILNKSRLSTLKLMPKMYDHIWLGKIKNKQGKIFIYSKLKFYDDNLNTIKEKIYSSEHKAIVDPAFGEYNCFTSAIIYTQIGEDIYLIDSGLIRNDSNSTTDESIINFLSNKNIKKILCESNFAQKELVKRLEKHFEVTPFYVHKNKAERIVSASYLIYDKVYFPKSWQKVPDGSDTDKWLKTNNGRGYIALRQLLNFDDSLSGSSIKGDVFSYLDFPDALSSLILFGIEDIVYEENDDKLNLVNAIFGE